MPRTPHRPATVLSPLGNRARLLLTALALLAGHGRAETTYQIQELLLPTGYEFVSLNEAADINNLGWVAGSCWVVVDGTYRRLPVLWEDGVPRRAWSLDDSDLGFGDGMATAVNDSGHVAGVEINCCGVLASPMDTLLFCGIPDMDPSVCDGGGGGGAVLDAGRASPCGDGFAGEFVHAVNNHGWVAGHSAYLYAEPGNCGWSSHGAVWQDGQALDVDPDHAPSGIDWSSSVLDLNDSGMAVGYVHDAILGVQVPAIWQGGARQLLGNMGGNWGAAKAVNAAGVVVGQTSVEVLGYYDAFRWQDGTMELLPEPSGSYSEAVGINAEGWVVGGVTEGTHSYAALWVGDSLVDLNTRIDGEAGWHLSGAMDINDRGEILCTGMFNGAFAAVVLKPASPRPPVLVLPGIAATYAADENDIGPWLFTRGIHPDGLRIDPLGHFYDDLLQTLDNAGYTPGEDLFAANYDWRVTPAPVDGVYDGVISGLSAAAITDGGFEHGVDYLGYWLMQAMDAWEAAHPGDTLREVDLIAHSTGGLVARAYLQSAARGGLLPDGRRLPEVRKLILVGVPNRGASKVWNPWHDNWTVDVTFQMVLSKMINLAFQKVMEGATVTGPDGDIDLQSLLECGEDLKICFLRAYVPTIHSLLATFPFLDTGAGFQDVNASPALRNGLILDLNAGLDLQLNGDPNSFADHAETTVIHATSEATPRFVVERLGEEDGEDALASFDAFKPRDAQEDELWYEDLIPSVAGDGTVPLISSMEQFVGDARVTLSPYTAGLNTQEDVSHCGMLFNTQVQEEILTILGADFGPQDISTGLHAEFSTTLSTATNIAANIVGGNLLSLVLDPVEGFLVDGQGRRLGWSAATGPVTEIPGSVWTGDGDGLGWQFGPLVEPVTLQVTGQDANHYAQASLVTSWGQGGLASSGFLAGGSTTSQPLPFPPLDAPQVEIAWSGPGQATLSWGPVPGATGYQVLAADTPAGPWTVLETTTASGTTLIVDDSQTRLLRVVAIR